uniref:SSD domain-containing protein n=1 Tax=Trichuris muris TaxID=70415 RepID=A0A5S6QSL0_TRIMR
MHTLRKLFIIDKFNAFAGISFLFLKKNLVYVIMASNRRNGSVINEHGLRCASDLISRIKEMKVSYQSAEYTWKDICYPTEEGTCAEHPLTQTLTLLKNTHQIAPSMQPLLHYPTILIDGFLVDNTPVLGGVSTRPTDNSLIRATAVRILFFLREAHSDEDAVVNELWRKSFLKTVESICYPGYSLYWSSWLSLTEEIQRNSDALGPYLPYLGLILLLMTVGGCCDGNAITSKPWLGVYGLLSAVFAILTSTGILFYCRYSYVPMVMMMPFLVLSVSVDNVFLMLSSWRATKCSNTVEDRTAESVGSSAVSILITSLTDGLSFLVGNLTPFPAVQVFCTHCALALLCTFTYQMSFFTALLALDGRREVAGRHCVTLRKTIKETGNGSAASKNHIMNSVADGWRSFDKYNEIFSSFLAAVVCSPYSKIVILITYVAYVAFFCYGLATVVVGLNVEHLLPRHSYIAMTLRMNDRYFSAYADFATVFVNQTFSVNSRADQERLLNLYYSLTSTEFSAPGEFWLKEAMSFAQSTNESLVQDPRRAEMVLNKFFTDNRYQHYVNDIGFEDESFLVIRYTKMSVRLRQAGRSNYTRIAEILTRRFDESALAGFVFHPSFLLVDQDSLVLQTLIQDILAAVTAMVLVVMLFISSCWSIIWVGIAIVSICLGVIGILSFWRVHIDMISMITITMSIGLSVDYIAHATYHYSSAYGVTPYDRLVVTYRNVAIPTVQSGLLAIAGVSALVLLESHMVETFVKTVFLVVLIGMAHGLIFMPALLSTIMRNMNGTPRNGTLRTRKNSHPTGPTIAVTWQGREASTRYESSQVSTYGRTTMNKNSDHNNFAVGRYSCKEGLEKPALNNSRVHRSEQEGKDMYLASMFPQEQSNASVDAPKKVNGEVDRSPSNLVPVTSPMDLLRNSPAGSPDPPHVTQKTVSRDTNGQTETKHNNACDFDARQELVRMILKGDMLSRSALNRTLLEQRSKGRLPLSTTGKNANVSQSSLLSSETRQASASLIRLKRSAGRIYQRGAAAQRINDWPDSTISETSTIK